MAKYNLCYKDGEDIKVVDLSALPFFKVYKKNANKIEEIDQFTSLLPSKEWILKYLKMSCLINENINDLFITIERKNGQVNIFNGKEFILDTDKRFLDISQIYSWITQNKYNHEYIIALAETYIKKYENLITQDKKIPRIITSLQTMRAVAVNMRNNKLMDTDELKIYIESINHFVAFEFYYLKNGKKLKDREGKIKKKYRNIRDFAIFIKKIDKIVKDMEQNFEEEVRETVYEEVEEKEPKEEFLTEEDYNKNYEQFMENYKGRKFETYEEIGREWDGKVTEGDLEAAYLPNKHKKR